MPQTENRVQEITLPVALTETVSCVQGPIIELSFISDCEHMCKGICGASHTAKATKQDSSSVIPTFQPDKSVIEPSVFEEKVLKPFIESGLSPALVTLTGGSIGLPANRQRLEAYMNLLTQYNIPIKLSTTLFWEGVDDWRYIKEKNIDVRRIHTSYRDLTDELSELQWRQRGSGKVVLKNLERIRTILPEVHLEIESLLSRTLAPHLKEMGLKIAHAMDVANLKANKLSGWEWQLQTLKASGNALSLDDALLEIEIYEALKFLEDPDYLSNFPYHGIKLLCMPPVCTEVGRNIQRMIDNSNGVIWAERCTEGQVSTQDGVPSGVVYISPSLTDDGQDRIDMRPCFIVSPPSESDLPDLLTENAAEAYLTHPFFVDWRNSDLVPTECSRCDLAPHGSFDTQHKTHCLPNCRASACSIDTSLDRQADLQRKPWEVEVEYRNYARQSK